MDNKYMQLFSIQKIQLF